MHAVNRSKRDKLLLSMLIPVTLAYVAYIGFTFQYQVLDNLKEVRTAVNNTIIDNNFAFIYLLCTGHIIIVQLFSNRVHKPWSSSTPRKRFKNGYNTAK